MNPNVLLNELRALSLELAEAADIIRQIETRHPSDPAQADNWMGLLVIVFQAERLAIAAAQLDHWLATGGCLPSPWVHPRDFEPSPN